MPVGPGGLAGAPSNTGELNPPDLSGSAVGSDVGGNEEVIDQDLSAGNEEVANSGEGTNVNEGTSEGEGGEGFEGETTEGEAEGDVVEGEEGEEVSAEGEEGESEVEEEEAPSPQDAQLADLYRDHPELKQVFKEHPSLRPVFFKAAQINRIYRTVQDAERAKDWAMQLASFDRLYFSGRPEDTQKFVEVLWENSLDENGKPSGHYERLAETMTHDTLTNLYRRVANSPSWAAQYGLTQDQARSAVIWAARLLGLRSFANVSVKPTAAGGASANLTPELQERFAELERREAALAAHDKQSEEARATQWVDGLHQAYRSDLGTQIDKIFGQSTGLKQLKPRVVNALKRDIIEEVTNKIQSDEFFESQIEALTRSGNRSQEHANQIIAELKSRVREELPGVAREVLRDAGYSLLAVQGARNARSNAASSRREPVTKGAAPGRIQRPSKPETKQKQGEDYNAYANRILGI